MSIENSNPSQEKGKSESRMPITTEAATAVEASGAGRLSATDRSQTLRLKSQMAASVPGLFF